MKKKRLFWGIQIVLIHILVLPSYGQTDSTENLMQQLNEVVISSVVPNTKMPFPVSALKHESILQKQSSGDLPFLVTAIPSAVAYSDGGGEVGYTGLRIRGSDLTRVNVTINGVPYNDAESHQVYFVNISDIAFAASEISIQRGVGVSAQGTSSIGATMTINTLPQLKNELAFAMSYGSFNSLRTAVKATAMLGKKWSLQGRFSWTNTDGYRDRASATLLSGGASMLFKPSDNFESALLFFIGQEKVYLAWYGITEQMLKERRTYNPLGIFSDSFIYKNQTDNYRQTHLQWINSFQISPKISLHSTTFFSKGDGYYEEFIPDVDLSTGEYKIKNVVNTKDTIIRKLHLDNSFFGQQILFSFRPNDANKLLVGISANKYAGKHFGIVKETRANKINDYTYYQLPADKYDMQSFARWEWNNWSKKIFLFADVQWRNVLYRINGFRTNPTTTKDVNYHFVNPKVGVSYLHKWHKWYASFALGQREPIRGDFENNIQQLPKPEELYDIEMGYVFKKQNSIFAQLSFFAMLYKNQLVNTGKITDQGEAIRENVLDSRRLGVEIEYQISLIKNLVITGSSSLSDNRIATYQHFLYNADNNTQVKQDYSNVSIAFSPAWINNIQVSYQAVKGFFISLEHQYVGEQYLDNTGDDNKKIAAYNVWNGSLRYNVTTQKWGVFLFTLFCKNILSTKYVHNGYADSRIENGSQMYYNTFFPASEFNIHFSINWNMSY